LAHSHSQRSVFQHKVVSLSGKYSVTPNIEPEKIVELLRNELKLLFVLPKVARWVFSAKEIFAHSFALQT
jgi:hypothetical protein